MLVPYEISDSSAHYRDYYSQQKGHGLSVYKGATIQRGHGIGGFFSTLLKGAMPLAMKGLKAVGRQAISSGWNVARDAISGRDVGQSARTNLKTAGDNLVGRLVHSMAPGRSSKRAKPPAKPRRRKRKSKAQRGSGASGKRRKISQHKTRGKRDCSDICSGILVE